MHLLTPGPKESPKPLCFVERQQGLGVLGSKYLIVFSYFSLIYLEYAQNDKIKRLKSYLKGIKGYIYYSAMMCFERH